MASMRKASRGVIFCLAFLWIAVHVLSANEQSAVNAPYSPPVQREDGWLVTDAGSVGFNEAALAALTQSIREGKYLNVHAVLVEKAGQLVYEAYFEGEDENWGDPLGNVVFDHETLHDLRSISKSVTSALLGIALGGGYEMALNTPLPAYFPDLKDRISPELDKVSLQHALTMTAGLEWNEMTVPYTDPSNDEARLYTTKDPVGMVLSRPLRDPPGSRWYYNGGLTEVIAGIIERKTGKPLDDYAEDVLFKPLGIINYEWRRSSLWPSEHSPSASSGLRLSARDLAKFGSLFLNQGRWQGKQIIPVEWVSRSIKRHVQDIPWGLSGIYGYGFMWYPGHTKGMPGFPVIHAVGHGDQRIFILPKQEIVVTIFAGLYNEQRWVSESILRQIVVALELGSK